MLYKYLSITKHKTKTDEKGCWVWQGAISDRGYAVVSEKAHKVMWELEHGFVPEGKELHHTCKNRRCINPEHLEVVSRREHLGKTEANPIGMQMNQGACKRGHVFDEVNTVWRKDGSRACRKCEALRQKKWREHHAAKAAEKEEVTKKEVVEQGYIIGPVEGYDEPWAEVKARQEARRAYESRRAGVVARVSERASVETAEERRVHEWLARKSDPGVEVDLELPLGGEAISNEIGMKIVCGLCEEGGITEAIAMLGARKWRSFSSS